MQASLLSSRAALPLVLGAAALLLAAGVLSGMRLGERASQPPREVLSVADAAGLDAAPGPAMRSPGGFTGFGGPPALQGDVLRRGIVARAGEDALEVRDGAATVRVEYGSPMRLFHLGPASGLPAAGEPAVVRVEGGGVTAILRSAIAESAR